MANVHKPTENIKTDVATAQATLSSSSSSTIVLATYFSMKNYDLAWFLVFTGARTGVASLSCQMHQRVGAAGGTATLKTAATVTTADAVDATLFARGEDFTPTYTHVALRITEGAGANFVVGSLLLRLRARYKQATLLA